MVRIPSHREPTHPGEMLLEEFLIPMGITQKELAYSIHVPYQRVNEIVNKKRGITPSTALRLAKYFGMSEDFWINLQLRWDLYKTKSKEYNALKAIKPAILQHASAQFKRIWRRYNRPTLENPVDLESYIDFLEEIEAFDAPKKKPIHYKTEFEL